ncbi:hypothetical protein SAMN05421688_2938 [Poseidonocella pacifica]|uniref:Uncharacterized protein n=1 Tax=Poseidonocella pacifica TaxID=871651 RepID=A0A1I0YCH0_9RHOB|nr:hypothetical protein [Poseidonocella pacifica]SFB11085.1 hypothetical protein SAMN05421688_2938 [Poseidonocella pacifica]
MTSFLAGFGFAAVVAGATFWGLTNLDVTSAGRYEDASVHIHEDAEHYQGVQSDALD